MAYKKFTEQTKGIETKAATVTNAVAPLSTWAFSAAALLAGVRAVISCRSAGVMLTWDGTTPSATTGHYCGANATVVVVGAANIAALKMFREAAVDATVTITLESWE